MLNFSSQLKHRNFHKFPILKADKHKIQRCTITTTGDYIEMEVIER